MMTLHKGPLPWLGISLLLLVGLVGCDYGRMRDQAAIQTYGAQEPEMPPKSIPVTGGLYPLKQTNPEKLGNPLPFTRETVDRGKSCYGHYCVMCHGTKADGNGTVGQSFSPLPTDLRSPSVHRQSDGRLFYTLTFGLGRHPGLGFMVSEGDRWALVSYLRSLR